MAVIGKGVLDVGFDPKQVEADAKATLHPSVKRIATDLAGVFAATKIVGFAKEGIQELKEAAAASSNVQAVIKATGGVAGVTAEHVDELADSQLKLTGTDDEIIKQGAAKLLTFKAVANQVGEGNDVFDRATKLSLDLAQTGFGSVESASVLLGKALNDPVKGLTALQRVGVALTESQKEQVKALVASGDVLGAQKVILAEVESQVGGAAEAFGKTLPGRIAIADESLKNMKAQLTAGFAPALELGANLTTSLTEKIAELPEGAQTAIGGVGLLGGGILALARPVNDSITLFRTLSTALKGAAIAEQATAAATAVNTEAQALNSASSVTNLYAKQSRGLVGVLGPAGIAGALVLGTTAAYQFGKSLNDVSISEEELTDVTRAAGDEQKKLFLQLANKAALGEGIDSVLKRLTALGPAGVGSLEQLKEEFASSPEAVKKLDDAIAKAKSGHDNFNTAAEKGKGILDDESDSAVDASGALEGLAKKYDRVRSAADNAFEATLRLAPADIRAKQGLLSLQEDQERVRLAQEKVDWLKAARAPASEVADAERDLAGAQLDVQQAYLDEAQALADVAKEQDAARGHTESAQESTQKYLDSLVFLNAGLEGPTHDALNQYIWDITVARDRTRELRDAQLGLGPETRPTDDQGRLLGPSKDRQAFALGGLVPGPIGAPVPALVHGGEFVLTADQVQGIRSGMVAGAVGGRAVHIDHVNVYGQDAPTAVRRLPDELRAAAYLAGV